MPPKTPRPHPLTQVAALYAGTAVLVAPDSNPVLDSPAAILAYYEALLPQKPTLTVDSYTVSGWGRRVGVVGVEGVSATGSNAGIDTCTHIALPGGAR